MRVTDGAGTREYAPGLRAVAGSRGLVLPEKGLTPSPGLMFRPPRTLLRASAWGEQSSNETSLVGTEVLL